MQTGGEFVVSQSSYQGPLSLLLKLIESNKLTIDQISLESVTSEYLKSIEKLTVHEDEINSFLRIAAALILIKSQDLLPDDNNRLADDIPDEQELAQQLRTYKRFVDAAHKLQQKMTSPSYLTTKAFRSADNAASLKINPQLLQRHFTQITQRLTAQKVLKQRPAVRLKSLPIMDQLKSLVARLSAQKSVAIKDWLDAASGQRTKIANFLALLEVVNSGRATIDRAGTEVRWIKS